MSSENEEDSDGESADELSDERVDESINPRSHQRSPLSFQSNTSCEEDETDVTDRR